MPYPNQESAVSAIAAAAHVSELHVIAYLKALRSIFISEMRSNSSINLEGLGVFKPFTIKAHNYRDPRTGLYKATPARKSISFTPNVWLSEAVN